ncbi:putative lipoprotein [Myxococcus stipitatus DSM 14675]|uniref:Putative lipoprotein n=1 Tax=Myxococcus stipitatus (strain DSM 14675 / JCM 12634 / Mx s8) TaxID=1278073 RepID=L7U7M6_MYXSD|nr:hypothetical protein [Myxococcus stipitatus]AGC43577.1 putative lipoprotein [Myxococcus stipitatus DSM 14675]
MRSGLLWCCLVLSLTSACRKAPPLRVPIPEATPRVRVAFQPPVDRVLTESQRASRTVEKGGSAVREEVELTTESRFTPSSGGWLLTQGVTHARQTRAGVEVKSWVDDVLKRFMLRVQLAADGAFVKLVSPESAGEAVRQSVPPGVDAGPLERFFQPEVLEARTRREWEAKFGGLFQRYVSEGQRTWVVEVLPVGDTQVAYVLERTVQGTRDTEFGDAVVLSLRCLDAVPEDGPDALEDAWVVAGRPELTPGVTCQGEQVVAYGRFVPVSRELTVKAQVDGAMWTLTMESRAQGLQEEAR